MPHTSSALAHHALLAIIYLSFLSLGLPDGVLGVAWPAMRADLSQPLAAVGLISIAVTANSGLCTLVSGHLLRRLGTGPVIMISGFLTGLALLGFSGAPAFWWLLVLAIPLGLGAGAVDAGLNSFVATHYSARHMNWLHGSWGIGATLGPFIMGTALAGTGGWSAGYRNIALLQLGMALVLWLTLPLWKRENAMPATHRGVNNAPHDKTVAPWAPWLAPLGFLLYVSAEMGAGLWAASILVTQRGLSTATAGLWVSLYFGAITAGRFAIGSIANRLGNRRLIRLGILTAATGAGLFALSWGAQGLALTGLLLMGLGCAPIYPCMMHETARRFPAELSRKVVARQIGFSYVGVSIIPAGCGVLASYFGLGVVMPAVLVFLIALLWVTETLNRLT
jgi:fucose permease